MFAELQRIDIKNILSFSMEETAIRGH
ncbi:hypothetical protein EZS27_043718 [termite gut metagenome]|uniref:Uncharacterized protein n=1 Tax=termite gut metagenome TaxID=433724 RepID=A0A5J4P5F9_9ZZZZ